MIESKQVIRLYQSGKGIVDLRKKFGVRSTVIRQCLLDNGIKLRSRSEARLRPRISTKEIVQLYAVKKLSRPQIAARLGINEKTVLRRLEIAKVPLRDTSEVFSLRSLAPRKPRRLTAPAEMFWKKVNKNGPIPKHCPQLGRCWIWIGGKDRAGRGHFSYVKNGVRINLTAPRFSFEQEYGPLPASKPFACHHCDNPPCIRPSHLFVGSHQDNMDDCKNKGRMLAGEDNPQARLTLAQARKIRSLYAAGSHSQESLGKQFGLSQVAVGRITRNIAYKEATL
jgi:hypothetical protein